MAAVMTEPDKSAVLGNDMIYMSVPIEKSEDTDDINPVDGTPDLMIWGKVTDGTLDSDLQIVDPEASKRWVERWHATKSNIRMGHDPKRPVGRGMEVDGHYVKALIADPVAKHLIRRRVLNDYSIGIMHPDVRVRDPQFRHLDPMGKAVNGVITDRPDGITGLGEISVVDRGANFGSSFQLVKSAADGTPEWVGAWDHVPPAEVVEKVAGEGVPFKTVTLTLPANMGVRITPKNLARLNTLTRQLTLNEQQMKAASPVALVNKAAAVDEIGHGETGFRQGTLAEDEALEFIKAAEAAVYKRDIDTATRRRLASEGHALPNLSYPIENEGDLENAARLARSGHGDVPAATALIGREARRFGVPNPMKKKPKGGKKAEKSAGDCAVCKGRGYVKPDKNVKCDACGGSGRATSKAAEPDVTKCTGCGGTGMAGGKPCPDCDDGRRAAEKMLDAATTTTPVAEVANKKGKMRAICPGCGAKQNPDHKHCPECGNALPARALQVKKNHDFVCLGCGHELDKGEPHCPECGKENPGYLPEADRKIPANADKAAKERVSKKAKKGKKDKMPFGGKQTPPFGAKDKDKDGDDAEKTAAPAPVTKKKKGGKGRDPAAGVTGHSTEGLPRHREPDGAPIEQFENDAHLEDGDQEMKTALRHKASGLDPDLAVLHDLTCPAFSPAAVSKALPYASFAQIDTNAWQQKALNAAAGGSPAQFAYAQTVGHAAGVLKGADPQVLQDVRLAGHAAFLDANADLLKTFRDATPGPGSAPTPGHISPQSFRRPYIGGGHAAESPMAQPMRDFPVINDHPVAADFHRDYISGGHAAESPMNGPRVEPVPEHGTAGAPGRVEYGGMMRADYEQALRTMHDHVSRIAPGICPMSPPVGEGTQKPAPQVPEAVGGPMPHGAKASKAEVKARRAQQAAKAAAAKARKAKTAAREQRRFDKAVAAAVAKTQAPQSAPETVTIEGEGGLTPDAVAAALKTAIAPLVKTQKTQARTIRKQAKLINVVAGQADTTGAPRRGAGVAPVNKTSTALAGPRTMAEASDGAQLAKYRLLHDEWRNQTNPELREAAWAEMQSMLGTSPMTSTDLSARHPNMTS